MDHCCKNPAITAERKGSPGSGGNGRGASQPSQGTAPERKGRADGLGGSPNALRIASDEAAAIAR
ncbi:MAG: hypothetical protein NT053_07410 [Cyanobacteria bacterium]|nr:hypothetical protein [Cyanobacteriota bacterium]